MTARREAGHHGLLEGGRSQSGTKRREVRTLKLRTIHSTLSPWRSRGKSCGRLTRSAEARGPHFPDPLAQCGLALPSFLLQRNDRVGLVAVLDYSIFSSLLSGANTGNNAPRGTDR